ncbi:MAG: phosphatase PAP2 family protein [Bacteroidota bacterium]|nr:phosphatase PAP2 family protein [Bacteroidota bacterium]
MDLILELDRNLLIFLNSLGSEKFDDLWLIITNKFTHIPLYLLLVFFLFNSLKSSYKKYKLYKVYSIYIISIVFLIFISDQLSNLFKYSIKRLRPCHDDQIQNLIRIVKEDCGGLYSFFSAHASNSFVVATIFILFMNRKKEYYSLLIWASLVAYSRVYIGVHYPADIIIGSLLGITVSYLFYTVIFDRIKRKLIY